MNIGAYTIDLIETGRFGLDGGAMFGVVPRTMWEKAYTLPDERNRIPMAARVLVLRGNGKVILVDSGNTSLMNEKLSDIYKLDFSTYSISDELRHLGISEQDVTDIILTHLHFDHAGGLTMRTASGEIVPRFPNARVYVQKDHFAWAQNPTEKDRASFIPETWESVRNSGLMELVDGPGELMPGIHLDVVNGHSKGLQTVRVSDGNDHIFFPADLIPTSAHIAVPFVMGYDNFPLTAIEEKKRIIPRIVDERWLVVFGHDALRQAGYLHAGAKGAVLESEVVLSAR